MAKLGARHIETVNGNIREGARDMEERKGQRHIKHRTRNW